MENLVDLGLFLGGLGVFFAGIGVLYGVSVWDKKWIGNGLHIGAYAPCERHLDAVQSAGHERGRMEGASSSPAPATS